MEFIFFHTSLLLEKGMDSEELLLFCKPRVLVSHCLLQFQEKSVTILLTQARCVRYRYFVSRDQFVAAFPAAELKCSIFAKHTYYLELGCR